MTNRPMCPKGQRKAGSPCIFCQDGSYCAHQYYCPETRRYENTRWRECRKMNRPAGADVSGRPRGAAPTEEQRTDVGAAALSGPSLEHDPPPSAGPMGKQEAKKEEEVTPNGAKKSNRRKPRKG